MSEQVPDWFSYDSISDTVTIDGCRFSLTLLRQFTQSPIGERFRIVSREDGILTVSHERDPLEAAAPDMLAALKAMSDATSGFDPMYADQVASGDGFDLARAAIAKAEGRK